MANKANINTLIKTLNSVPDHKFNMELYISDAVDKLGKHCGTAGCIAGWAAMLATKANPKKYEEEVHEHIEEVARTTRIGEEVNRIYNNTGPIPAMAANWLGINGVTAEILFTPGDPVVMDLVTNKDAVKMLRILRDKGKVTMADWKRVLKG